MDGARQRELQTLRAAFHELPKGLDQMSCRLLCPPAKNLPTSKWSYDWATGARWSVPDHVAGGGDDVDGRCRQSRNAAPGR